MKIRTLAFFATGTLAVAPAMAQIPNGGFENWTTVPGNGAASVAPFAFVG